MSFFEIASWKSRLDLADGVVVSLPLLAPGRKPSSRSSLRRPKARRPGQRARLRSTVSAFESSFWSQLGRDGRRWRSSHRRRCASRAELEDAGWTHACLPARWLIQGVLAHQWGGNGSVAALCRSRAPVPETRARRSASGDSRRNPPPESRSLFQAYAEALSATTGIRAVPVPLRSWRATSVPCMSGKAQVEQDDVRPMIGREGDRVIAPSGFERAEPGSPEHIPGELPVLLAVIHDEDERRSRRWSPSRACGERDVIAVSSARADPARARR